MKITFITICLLLHFSMFSQKVDAGNGHAIILNKKGIVYTIGRNNFGQLGDSTFKNSANPIE